MYETKTEILRGGKGEVFKSKTIFNLHHRCPQSTTIHFLKFGVPFLCGDMNTIDVNSNTLVPAVSVSV